MTIRSKKKPKDKNKERDKTIKEYKEQRMRK